MIYAPTSAISRIDPLNCDSQQHGANLENWHPISKSKIKTRILATLFDEATISAILHLSHNKEKSAVEISGEPKKLRKLKQVFFSTLLASFYPQAMKSEMIGESVDIIECTIPGTTYKKRPSSINSDLETELANPDNISFPWQ